MAANAKPTTLGAPATTSAPADANVTDGAPPPTTSTSLSTPDATVSIRITPSGKLYTYVRHALDTLNVRTISCVLAPPPPYVSNDASWIRLPNTYDRDRVANTLFVFRVATIQERPDQPVEIHTRLSLNSSLPPIKVLNTSTTSEPTTSHSGGLLPCTTTIPRLITVLEIIKREYLRLHAGKGKGLWQYNKVGSYSGKEVEEWEEQQRGRRVVGLPQRVKGKGKAKAREEQGEGGGREEAVGIQTGNVDAVQQMDVDTAAGANGADAGEDQGAGATTTKTTTHADKVLTDILNGGPNQ
ncbi:hypothetical protein QFC22_006497 [Naganishia vaughanmartiniae]|uniref:Uncharacterized protein n=1 Tax=Naganishia vaughanmartiniae TaxID=1424756 RepID=A0ACC2WJF4_9TREE|nr:hypothetical protein QFC22_006497 [Naganishia vaughanmartiniae]